MSADFLTVCRRLLLASALAVALPIAAALILAAAQAAAGGETEGPVAAPHAMKLSDLGQANAVSWISTGHVSAR